MSDLKESHTVQKVKTVKIAIAQEIDHEPAFDLWVKHMLKKKERIAAIARKSEIRC